MATRTPTKQQLRLLLALIALAFVVFGCAATSFVAFPRALYPGATLRYLQPTFFGSCVRYAPTSGRAGSSCIWGAGAAARLTVQGPPAQALASYDSHEWSLRLGSIHFTVSAEIVEGNKAPRSPLYPLNFDVSLFLDGLP